MSNNTSSQTLFRFVSLRNPELTDTNNNPNFIQKPAEVRTEFDRVIYNRELLKPKKSKLEYLEYALKNYPSLASYPFYTTEDKLKQDFGSLLDAGKALAQNRKIQVSALIPMVKASPAIATHPDGSIYLLQEKQLWDSLIYQVISQQSFYVKEEIIQIFQVYNYVKNCIDITLPMETMKGLQKFVGSLTAKEKAEWMENLANARVVLPPYLFIDDYPVSVPTDFQVNVSRIGNGIIDTNISDNGLLDVLKGLEASSVTTPVDTGKLVAVAQKNTNLVVAKGNIEKLKALKKDIQKAKENYQKDYQKAYEVAQKQYIANTRPKLEAYDLAVLEAKAALPVDATPAMIELAVKKVNKPIIPEFEFNYQKEMDAAYLQTKISAKNQKSLGQLIGVFTEPNVAVNSTNKLSIQSADIILPEDNYQTFDEVLSLVDEKIVACNNLIYENTNIESQKLVNIGGVLIPQAISGTQAAGSYTLIPYYDTIYNPNDVSVNQGSYGNYYGFNLSVDTGVSGLTVQSMTFTLSNQSSINIAEVTTEGTVYHFNNIFHDTISEEDFKTLTSFSAEVIFSDGSKFTFTDHSGYTAYISYTGTINYTPVVIGGDIDPTKAYDYTLCGKSIQQGQYNLDLSIMLPDDAWDISNIDYIIIAKAKDIWKSSDNYYEKSKAGNVIHLNNLFKSGLGITYFTNSEITVNITFINGYTATIVSSAFSESCQTGTFVVQAPNTGGGTGTTNPTLGDTKAPMIPTGFGIKRLGIADYLKVEQTTHAYIEGEVANIENIMAREYREKSTRRLRKNENTNTTSTDTEKEKLTDTTVANRFEMQSEIAKMQQESNDFSANVGASTTFKAFGGSMTLSAGANYANHRSKEESTRQAVQQAQDITARALDRVVTKVHQERIEKITEEFEENNKHGFDNRTGDQHVVGVYRWVDKLMKNQIYNYGKRMMFEFMIPQPSKLHKLAMDSSKNQNILKRPVDPRTSNEFNLSDYSKLDDITLKYWSGKLNVILDKSPEDSISISKSLKLNGTNTNTETTGAHDKYIAITDKILIPEGYYSSLGYSNAQMMYHMGSNEWAKIVTTIGTSSKEIFCDVISASAAGANVNPSTEKLHDFNFKKYYNEIGVSAMAYDSENQAIVSFTIICNLSAEAKENWKQKTFNAIIKAYEDALAEYESKVAEANTQASNIKDANPMFYRQIEQEVLRHNCIAYLTDDSTLNQNTVLGKTLYAGDKTENYEVLRKDLDNYAALAKFMEQAFEWEIMSYDYYPYYWGKRADWDTLYQADNVDPLFRSFLHSGMARVIVTVKPGFEDAITFYLATGKIWSGGEVPVIGDPMYLSIVDEMVKTKGEPQGKAWLTRLPTPLTILQAESIGLKVESALPYTHENPDNFEDPTQVITQSNFHNTGTQLGLAGTKKQIQFSFEQMNKHQTIGEMDAEGLFPRIFSCMGREIYIDRDASWSKSDRIEVFYKVLAEKVSYIDGVTAYPLPYGNNGLRFVVDVSKIKTFEFRKPGGDPNFDLVQLETDGETFIHFQSPKGSSSAVGKLSDKNGVHITGQESDKTLPFSRFLL